MYINILEKIIMKYSTLVLVKTIKRSISTIGRNQYWKNITNQCEWVSEIIENNLTWEEACEREKYWIKFYGRKDLNEGTLVNMTDGGDGNVNRICTTEFKEKLRNFHKGKLLTEQHKEKISNSSKGKKISNEQKIKISKTLSGRKLTDEHKNNISKKMKGKFVGEQNPKFGKKLSDETKEKISLKSKNRKKMLCPHCGRYIDITVINRYHFDNCKLKSDL